jgi:alkaline phosphatase D
MKEGGISVFQATGIKIGEVSDSEAIIWTRITRNVTRVDSSAPLPKILYKNPETGTLEEQPKSRRSLDPVVEFPNGSSIETIEGAVPGALGLVRVKYNKESDPNWKSTDWFPVDLEADFTRQFKLEGLSSNSNYLIQVECKDLGKGKKGEMIEGKFKTAPSPEQIAPVLFTVSTGQAYPDQDATGGGYKIYPQMLKLDPSFFVHTGDILYYDRLAKTYDLALWHWTRMYSLPTNVAFHRQVASYFIKDDHDTHMNDCWPGQQTKFMGEFTFEQGLEIFPMQVPMGEKTYRTFRWGKDLQIWLVEGRDFRSPNNMPDGPEKTIWGKEQKEWFKRTVLESDATFRLLISPTPIVGPDRENKHDNHSNKDFQTEGDEIRQFLASQKNMYVICGDRHWQYVSVNLETGVKEFSCGPASNEHAGGWSNDMLRPEHQYLNVIGGFLAVKIDRENGKPTAAFTHYSLNGEKLNEDKIEAKL